MINNKKTRFINSGFNNPEFFELGAKQGLFKETKDGQKEGKDPLDESTVGNEGGNPIGPNGKPLPKSKTWFEQRAESFIKGTGGQKVTDQDIAREDIVQKYFDQDTKKEVAQKQYDQEKYKADKSLEQQKETNLGTMAVASENLKGTMAQADASKYGALASIFQGYSGAAMQTISPLIKTAELMQNKVAEPDTNDKLSSYITLLVVADALEQKEKESALLSRDKKGAVAENFMPSFDVNPKELGIAGETIKVPDLNRVRVSDLGFERNDKSQGLLSDFKLYFIAGADDKREVIGKDDFDKVAKEVITVGRGKNKKYYFTNSDGTQGDEITGEDLNKLFAKPDYTNKDQNHIVMVRKDEAEDIYLNKSLGRSALQWKTFFGDMDPHKARELSEIFGDFKNDGILITIAKAAMLFMRSGKLEKGDKTPDPLNGADVDNTPESIKKALESVPAESRKEMLDVMKKAFGDKSFSEEDRTKALEQLSKLGLKPEVSRDLESFIKSVDTKGKPTELTAEIMSKTSDKFQKDYAKAMGNGSLSNDERNGLIAELEKSKDLTPKEKEAIKRALYDKGELSEEAKAMEKVLKDLEIKGNEQKAMAALIKSEADVKKALTELAQAYSKLESQDIDPDMQKRIADFSQRFGKEFTLNIEKAKEKDVDMKNVKVPDISLKAEDKELVKEILPRRQ